MNNDLISREALKKAIIELNLDNTSHWTVIHTINNAPTVDAVVNTIEVRPQGEWITENIEKPYGKCNQCGKICEIDNFCGNCGADMRKGGAYFSPVT